MIIKLSRIVLLLLASVPMVNHTLGQQLAFPGAEGAGRFTTGGRGTLAQPTTVFKVTSLADNNVPGTLRFAVSASSASFPHRTIVFAVSGTIRLTAPLSIRSNTTIAGQTAPGDGICLADYPVSISGNNVILRYLRFRMGDRNQNLGMVDGSGNGDALGSLGYKNIIVDHCSISWSSDEACTIYRGDSLTLQWNIVSEPLNYSYHFEAGDADFQRHGYGGIWGARRGSFHHNIIAHVKGRAPRFAGSSSYAPGTVGQEQANFYNNIIYNWESYSTNGGEGGHYNILNNFYKYGPSTSNGAANGVAIRSQIMNPAKDGALPYPKIFMEGNIVDGSPSISARNWLGVAMAGGSLADTNQSKVETPFDISPDVLQSAMDAYTSVLDGAGAVLPRRDTLDRRIVNDIRFRAGGLIDVQGGFPHGTAFANTINAWPNLKTLPAPADADNDGMPDAYELGSGLNPNDPIDRAAVAANGYTNLENYLNSIVNTYPEVFYAGLLVPFQSLVGVPSATQSYSISGINLNGAVTVKPPQGFEVSADGGANWFTNEQPLMLSPTGTALSNTSLTLRLNRPDAGFSAGAILHFSAGGDTTFVFASGTAAVPQAGGSAVLVQWPLTANNQDDAAVRHPGLQATLPVFNKLFLSNGTTVAAVPAYGTVHGQAFGPTTDGSALWTTSAGGPGGTLNRTYFEQFTIAAQPGFAGKVDSILLNASFYNTSSNTRFAIVYSKSGFVADSANVTGGVGPSGTLTFGANGGFATPVLLNNQTAVNSDLYRFALNNENGVAIGPNETLSLRLYFSCGSTSAGRYAKIKDVAIKGQLNNTLPIGLQAFDGWENDKKITLRWLVADNENYDFFVIERRISNGSFEPIQQVRPNLNKTSASYDYLDNGLSDGNLFYRLKLVRKDGNLFYSRTVIINRKLQGTFAIFPNPAVAAATVVHAKAAAGTELQVMNAFGQVVLRQIMQTGSTQTNINSSVLKPGRYNLVMRSAAGVFVSGFIKL